MPEPNEPERYTVVVEFTGEALRRLAIATGCSYGEAIRASVVAVADHAGSIERIRR